MDPLGRVFYSPTSDDLPAAELPFAWAHFFLPHRYRDPFHTDPLTTETLVTYDTYDPVETRDALGNTIHAANDYRVLGPRLMTDPNGNRAEVAFDALGLVVGTAVMGKRTRPSAIRWMLSSQIRRRVNWTPSWPNRAKRHRTPMRV